MSIGGLLLGAMFGAVVAFFAGGPLWLFARFGYVLPAVFGVAGGIAVRRVPWPGRFAIASVGWIAALAIGAAFCWWIWNVLTHIHGWF
jgi:hypothetical protein